MSRMRRSPVPNMKVHRKYTFNSNQTESHHGTNLLSLALARAGLRALLRGAGLARLADLPPDATDHSESAERFGRSAVHRRPDPPRPAGLACGGRPTTKHKKKPQHKRRTR